MAKKTGGAKKTETFTTRLEPREKYILELLARVSGRSIAKTLEAAIQREARETPLRVPGRPDISASVLSLMNVLWSPQEWKRIISLGAVAPELLTYEEECKLTLVVQSSALCSSVKRTSYGGIVSVEIRTRLIELAWPLIEERAQMMADGRPAPTPTVAEIEAASGEKVGSEWGEDGVHFDFSVLHSRCDDA